MGDAIRINGVEIQEHDFHNHVKNTKGLSQEDLVSIYHYIVDSGGMELYGLGRKLNIGVAIHGESYDFEDVCKLSNGKYFII